MKNKEPSAMDCWHFIAPLIPATDNFSMKAYVKTFHAFQLLEEEEKSDKCRRYKNNSRQNNR